MADDVRLSEAEHQALTVRNGLDEPIPVNGLVEVVRLIVASHVKAARAEDAARLAEVEATLARVSALADEWEARARAADIGTFAKRQRWAPALLARSRDVRAALGVTAPTASEAGA